MKIEAYGFSLGSQSSHLFPSLQQRRRHICLWAEIYHQNVFIPMIQCVLRSHVKS